MGQAGRALLLPFAQQAWAEFRCRTWIIVCVLRLHLDGFYEEWIVVTHALNMAGQHVVREELHAVGLEAGSGVLRAVWLESLGDCWLMET